MTIKNMIQIIELENITRNNIWVKALEGRGTTANLKDGETVRIGERRKLLRVTTVGTSKADSNSSSACNGCAASQRDPRHIEALEWERPSFRCLDV